MIDRIRQDIQARLDQLLSEADRLRQALSALGGDGGSRTPARSDSSSSSRSSAASTTQRRPRAARSTSRTRSTTRSTARRSTRASSGGTKDSVLKALSDASGNALTASEVAAATGLGRASVSTTLSKLARAGEVQKAERGYRLVASNNGGSPATADTKS
jgi:biotin operon repressor